MKTQLPSSEVETKPSGNDVSNAPRSPWKGAHDAGFLQVPNVLIKNQKQMGLSPTDLAVLLNIAMHWWAFGRLPFPKTNTIAKRMGVDKRTVQRSIRKLADLKLIKRVKSKVDGEEVSAFDLSGLVGKLEVLALADPWHRQQKKELVGTDTSPPPGQASS